jgi:CO/xanthine dehydrogenase Mo-binding subunit
VGIKECIEKSYLCSEVERKKGKRGRGKKVGWRRGVVMSLTTSSSFVKMNEDGTAEVQISSVDMGQGSNTALAQIAAEVGLNVEDVRVVRADTDLSLLIMEPLQAPHFHGECMKIAAADAKRQLLEVLADLLESESCRPGDPSRVITSKFLRTVIFT